MLREIYRAAGVPRPGRRARSTCPATARHADARSSASPRAKGGTVFHPVGTCRMGGDARRGGRRALRVRGVERLRVIDASVMPRLVSANTNAAAIMIGEKGAALLIEDQAGGSTRRASSAKRRRRDPRQGPGPALRPARGPVSPAHRAIRRPVSKAATISSIKYTTASRSRRSSQPVSTHSTNCNAVGSITMRSLSPVGPEAVGRQMEHYGVCRRTSGN